MSSVIYYSDFGAAGDGKTDDFDAIVRTHEAANKQGLAVRADPGAAYYIGGAGKTAVIQTDTDWSGAKFIIDDTKVEKRSAWIFEVTTTLPPSPVNTVKTLSKNQEKLDLTLPYDSLIVVTDTTTMRYIRSADNPNSGQPQSESFIVDKNGNVDMNAPIIWDYANITSMIAYPLDPVKLTLTGGHFTTVANRGVSEDGYYTRGIRVHRSNTVVDGVTHVITGQGETGAPYNGFINVHNSANVTVQNCNLTARKFYRNARGVNQGTYGMSSGRSVNLLVKDCKQLNDIHSAATWGIFISNQSKNITFDGVEFSRFDAHEGVANATVRNSVIGRGGINLVGGGIFTLENTKVYAAGEMITLRNDYGSTWEGEIFIRNSEYIPANGMCADTVLIYGSNNGRHNFGYVCYLPRKVTIDGLIIRDMNPTANYQGPKIFSNFNGANTSADYVETYPYIIDTDVIIKDMTVMSNLPYIKCPNAYMFRNVRVIDER